MTRETIYALATTAGRAGLAVVRVSGPRAIEGCSELFDRPVEVRKPVLRTVTDPETGEVIDEALILVFREGASFTGEDVTEFHLHGSPAVVRALIRTLQRFEGFRPAEPGEFTRRALEYGRLDLVQVEGLSDLVEAETEAQKSQALKVMRGDLSRKVDLWRGALIEIAALLETMIDFSDEELPGGILEHTQDLVRGLADEFGREIEGSRAAERIREGFEVALIGAPNVGKSTLLNRISGREVAITSEIAGTTRDVIEVHLELGGLAVTMLDTAGIRESHDVLEAMGVERTRARADTADLRVFLIGDGDMGADLYGWRDGDIIAVAKADLLAQSDRLAVSGLTGLGVDELLQDLTQRLSEKVVDASSLVRERHRLAMEVGHKALKRCLAILEKGSVEIELAAEEIRIGLQGLDEMVGRVNVEGLLDVIFSKFCIGK